MEKNNDILAALDFSETPTEINDTDLLIVHEEEIEKPFLETQGTYHSILKKCRNFIVFMLKYMASSLSIFAILLLAANYSAYWNIAYNVLYAQDLENTKVSLTESIAKGSVSKNSKKSKEILIDSFKQLKKDSSIKSNSQESIHSMRTLLQNTSNKNIDLGIEITPYENRIVIPKIGKNIPLVDIKQKKVNGSDELNNIFMKELEDGVVRYPGTAKPGEEGNAFVFGHSSNFPWVDGDYNQVFALLDNVVFDDDVIIYYNQQKYTYKIRTKSIIKPGDVSVLQKNVQGGSKITLMTCWPIGTTLNRLVLTGDLIEVQ